MPNPKRQIFEGIAELARAIGHTHRLELLEQLAQGERSVEVLAQRVGLSVANVSQHLQHLRRTGLAQARQDGKRVLYRLGGGPFSTPWQRYGTWLSGASRRCALVDLPKDHEIVAFCRGTYCVLLFDAVAALRAKGYRIWRLEDGFPEWKAAGLAGEAA